MIAWGGDIRRRDDMVARFRRVVTAGGFEPDERSDANVDVYHGPLHALTGTQDPMDFVEASGYPLAVALAVTPVAQHVAREAAADLVIAWLTAAAPGADLSSVPSAVLLDTLSEPGFAAPLRASRTSGDILDRLMTLHAAEADGAAVPPAEWRAMRKAAVALVDDAPAEEREALSLLEAIAWPLSGAPELLRDLLWAAAVTQQAAIVARRAIPPARPGDDLLVDRLVDEQLTAGLTGDDAYTAVTRILADTRPDFVERGAILEATMQEALPLAAEALSDRIVDRLARA